MGRPHAGPTSILTSSERGAGGSRTPVGGLSTARVEFAGDRSLALAFPAHPRPACHPFSPLSSDQSLPARTRGQSGYFTQAPRVAVTDSWGHSAAALHVIRTRCVVASRKSSAFPYLISRRPPIALEPPNFRFGQTKFGLPLASARRGRSGGGRGGIGEDRASGAEQQPVAAGEALTGII